MWKIWQWNIGETKPDREVHHYHRGNTDGILHGMHIVITGTLWATRNRVHDMILSAGGYPQTHVDWRTNLIVIGLQPGNAKLQAARDRNLSYITGNDLMSVINDEVGWRYIASSIHSYIPEPG